jgi:hypothetical protein
MSRISLKLVCLALLIPALSLAAINPNPKTKVKSYPNRNGSEPVTVGMVAPVYPSVPVIAQTDIIGDTQIVGMTWTENQHNGTCGRMNTLESDGWRQFSWMKGENEGASTRHIWWNGIDPNGIQVFPGFGVAVEASLRGGYASMDVFSNGAGIVGYHASIGLPGDFYVIKASPDIIPHAGAFLDFQAPLVSPTLEVDWPRMQISQNGRLHVIGTQYTGTTGPQEQYYIGGVYDPTMMSITWDPAWTYMDTTMTIAADVATSPVTGSNKMVFGWAHNRDQGLTQLNNDLYCVIDADGLNPNFQQAVNLTQFIPPDLSLLPDTLSADRDTLRLYTDLNCFIDHNNFAHIAFTTRSFFEIEGTSYYNASIIWHWSEQFPDTFTVIGNYYAYNNNIDCGDWNMKAQRPSLGEDAAGTLYCMYQVFDTDTLHLTAPPFMMPSGEVYMTVSVDGGMHWAQGTNVTNTITPFNAQPGRSYSELTPTMAKKVDAYCHIQYVLDLDAGDVGASQSGWTNNPVKYHRVPVSLIPTTPLVTNIPLHVGALSGVPPISPQGSAPTTFALKQIYPNPFNSTTSITFTLEAAGEISLDVFNNQGQRVANVAKGTFGVGEHTVGFDAATMSSGVYYCKLISGRQSVQERLVLLK